MLEKDDWKIAIEDARFRQNALMQLIYAGDRQALSLLRLFLTLAVAAAGGALSIFLGTWSLPIEAAWALSAASALLLGSAVSCTLAIMGGAVNLAGRGAEFWLWAAEKSVTREEAFIAYLQNLEAKHETNKVRNLKQARALMVAKIGGLIATPIAAAIGASAYFWSRWG